MKSHHILYCYIVLHLRVYCIYLRKMHNCHSPVEGGGAFDVPLPLGFLMAAYPLGGLNGNFAECLGPFVHIFLIGRF